MNKVTKGTLAAAAAGVLLLGGAGTYATWSDEESLDAGTVSTGVLDLEVESGTWAQGTTHINEISEFQMVPGDTLTYAATATVTAEGDNLKGTLALADDLTAVAGSDDASQYLTVELVQPAYSGITGTNPNNRLAVAPDGTISFSKADTYQIPLKVTVTLDADAQNAQDLDVDLGQVKLTLTQS